MTGEHWGAVSRGKNLLAFAVLAVGCQQLEAMNKWGDQVFASSTQLLLIAKRWFSLEALIEGIDFHQPLIVGCLLILCDRNGKVLTANYIHQRSHSYKRSSKVRQRNQKAAQLFEYLVVDLLAAIVFVIDSGISINGPVAGSETADW